MAIAILVMPKLTLNLDSSSANSSVSSFTNNARLNSPVAPISATKLAASLPSAAEILNLPLASHPRLLASEARFAEIQSQIKTDPNLKKWYRKLVHEANFYVREKKLPKYEIKDGKRLLTISKRVLRKVSTLALIYRLNGEKQYDEKWLHHVCDQHCL